jgi:hypothetical protein
MGMKKLTLFLAAGLLAAGLTSGAARADELCPNPATTDNNQFVVTFNGTSRRTAPRSPSPTPSAAPPPRRGSATGPWRWAHASRVIAVSGGTATVTVEGPEGPEEADVLGAFTCGADPTTGVAGVKWDLAEGFDLKGTVCATFTVTIDEDLLEEGYVLGIGAVNFASKAGNQDVRGFRRAARALARCVDRCASTSRRSRSSKAAPPATGSSRSTPAPGSRRASPVATRASAPRFTGFNTTVADWTLLRALDGGGGSGLAGAQQILARAAVAALLNASHPEINYAIDGSAG